MGKSRRKLYDMPIAALYDHPKALALPAAGFGMVARLVIHFWITNCSPLPKDDNGLCCLARGHRPVWRHYKTEIMGILEDILPQLASDYQNKLTGRTALRIAGYNGRSTQARRAALQQLESAHTAPDSSPPSPPIPHRDSPPNRPPTPAKRAPRPILFDKG